MQPEEGYHTFVYPDGSKYEGYWLAGKKHGRGVHEFPSGGQYIGEFRNGMRHGEGRYIYPGGDVYTGSFVAGYREGEGEYVYAQGGNYTGEWVCDKMHGFGKAKDSTGKVLEGMWVNGQAHGTCKLQDGTNIRTVSYNNGMLVPNGDAAQQEFDKSSNKDPLSNGLAWLENTIANSFGCDPLGCGTRAGDMSAPRTELVTNKRNGMLVKGSRSAREEIKAQPHNAQ